MRVLIVARGYPTSKYRMNGIFEFDQAKALAKLGHDVILASIDMRSIRRKRKWGFEHFESDGVKIYGINLPLGRIPESILVLFASKALEYIYRKIIKDNGEPDIVHAHFPRMGYIAAKLKTKTSLPLVVTEHFSGMMAQPINPYIRKMAKIAYANADKVITVSPALKKVLEKEFDISSEYIPNIIDVGIFKYKERAIQDTFTFIAVGGLIDRKRLDLIIDAFNKEFQKDHHINLLIIGGGPEQSSLNQMIRDFDLTSRISLLGNLSRDEIANHMHQSNCFVLPSQAETFGLVYVEAMLTGLPVIATRCGGPEGFVDESNGILIDVDNIDQLRNAMVFMVNNANHWDNKRIANDAYNQFSSDLISKKIDKVYKEVLD